MTKLYAGLGTCGLLAVFALVPVAVVSYSIYVAMSTSSILTRIGADVVGAFFGFMALCITVPLLGFVIWLLLHPMLKCTTSGLWLLNLSLQWNQIATIEIRKYMGRRVVYLQIADLDSFFRFLPKYGRFSYRRQFKRTGNGIVVPAMRGISLEQLRELLQAWWDKNHGIIDPRMPASSYHYPTNFLVFGMASGMAGLPLLVNWPDMVPCIRTHVAACVLPQLGYGVGLAAIVFVFFTVLFRLLKRYAPEVDVVDVLFTPVLVFSGDLDDRRA